MIDLTGAEFKEEKQGMRLELGESPLKGMTLEKEQGAGEEDQYAEWERNYSLRDWEADVARKLPNAYATTRAIADLVPYGRYLFPSGRDALAAKGTGGQTLELALEALSVVPGAVIGKGIKLAGKGVELAGGKALRTPLLGVKGLLQRTGWLMPEARVMENPLADELMGQIPKFQAKGVTEQLMGKYGLMNDEAEAVAAGKSWVWRPMEAEPLRPKLHPEIPVSESQLNEIIKDVRNLYPEAEGVSIAGTYARLGETVSKTKSHDIDVLIRFPGTANKNAIDARMDEALWNKWRKDKVGTTIDFLKRFGEKEPSYGQHTWRLEEGLSTPEVPIWKRGARSGAFTPQMTEPMGKLFTKEGTLGSEVLNDLKKWNLSPIQQEVNYYSGQLDKAFSKILGGTKYTSEDLFRTQAVRLYGEAGRNMKLGNVGLDELGNILVDTLQHGTAVRKAMDISGWSQLKPVRKVLGGMENVWGTYKNLYKPFKELMKSSNLSELNYVRTWQGMLAGVKIEGKPLLEMKVNKLGETILKENYSRKELDLAGKLATDIDLAQSSGKSMDEVQALMSGAPPKVQAIAKTLHEWYDYMYSDFIKREIPLLFNKAGLTPTGKAAIQNLMDRPGGISELIDQTFKPGNNLPYTEKLKIIQGTLASAQKLISKSNLGWFTEKSLDQLSGGERTSLALRLKHLKTEALILRTNKSDKGFPGYLENYTARIPKGQIRPWTAEGGLPDEAHAGFTKPRLLDEPNYEVTTEIPKLVAARARAQSKELFLYPEIDSYKDFVKSLPTNLKAYSEHWINRLLGVPSPVDTKVARFLSRFSLKGWDERRVVDVAQKINDLTYMGGIGFKPFSAMRNYIQYPLMTSADLGGIKDIVWMTAGIRKAFDPQTRAFIRDLGAIQEYAPDLLMNLKVSEYGSRVDKLRDFAMWMFKASDRHNRYMSGGAALSKWDYYFARYGSDGIIPPSKLDGFLSKLNINSREEWIRNDLRKLLQTNTPESITEAKKLFTTDVIADTQFLYSREESPLIGYTWGAPGRVALVFQSWWMNYADDLAKWLFRTPETGKWISPTNERFFTFLLSSALAYEIMSPVWGSRTALSSVGFGPLPLDISLPPTIRPFQSGLKTIAQAGALLTPWGDLDSTRRSMVQLLKDTAIFVPGGIQAYHMVQGAKREGGEGIAKSLIRYKPDKPEQED